MSIKSLMATACGALLTVSAMSALAQGTNADDEKKAPACCMSAATDRCPLTVLSFGPSCSTAA